jgi:hypothetical protein
VSAYARSLCCLLLGGAGCASAVAPPPRDLAMPALADFASPTPDLSPFDIAGQDLAGDLATKNPSCPTGTIPQSVNTLYAGDTTGAPNLATDTRTSWAADPDHALLFVAPKAGNYLVSLTSSNQFGTDCGVVVRAYGSNNNGAIYDESACPSVGLAAAIDGAYAATPGAAGSTIALANAQHALMWVSCSSAAINRTMSYVLKVQFQ